MTPSLALDPPSAKATLDLLWSRVRQRGDMPGFSKVISTILGAMRGESEREFNMTKTVLADPALTQKVLRLANSPMYAVFGSQINTVSKAVIVLGTEAIGHLALGLKVVDGLQAAANTSRGARDEMEKAVLAGHVARQVSAGAPARDTEEVVVCSMLHSLGRMMVSFYLSDRWEQALEMTGEGRLSEQEAARQVLGLGLDDIGRVAAQTWGFPSSIVASFRDVPPQSTGEPLDHADWLAALATMSTGAARLIHPTGAAEAHKLDALAQSYSDMLSIDAIDIVNAVRTAQAEAIRENDIGTPVAVPAPVRTSHIGKPDDAAVRLAGGVAEMRDAADHVDPRQMLTMGLETVYKGLGFSRTIAFIRDRDAGKYIARLSLGNGLTDILPRLSFPDAYQPDVFHAALVNDKMIFIENAKASAFRTKLPRWWRENLPTAGSFVLLPLIANRQPMGFIYGDWDEALPHARIEAPEVTPLNDLRTLIVRSMGHRG